MKEAILRVMAVLAIYVGAKDATQLIAARGANVFGPFFATIFANGIEVDDETARKTEVYGIAQMLLNEPLFYQPPLNAAAQGLIATWRPMWSTTPITSCRWRTSASWTRFPRSPI